MNNFKKWILIILGFILVGVGFAFQLNVTIGVGAIDALSTSLSTITLIPVGTVGMIINLISVLGELVILKGQFKKMQFFQIPLSILLGMIVNYFLYEVLTFTIESFVLKITVFVLATQVCAIGISILMEINLVTMPFEGFCHALSSCIPLSFPVIRQIADVVCILVIVIVTIILQIPWSIGIGTIIGMLIFGPSLGFYMNKLSRVIK